MPLLGLLLPLLGSLGGSTAARMLLPRLLGLLGGRIGSTGLGATLAGSKMGQSVLPMISKGGKLGGIGNLMADLIGFPLGGMAGELAATGEIPNPGVAFKENIAPSVGFSASQAALAALGARLSGKMGRAVSSLPAQMIVGGLTSIPIQAAIDAEGVAAEDPSAQIQKLGDNTPNLSSQIAHEHMQRGFDNAELATALGEFGINLDDLSSMLSSDRYQEIF